MMVSKKFRAAIKLADRPAWRIAYEADVHPNVLSKIMSGAIRVRQDDKRVLRVAKIVGLAPADCFDVEGK